MITEERQQFFGRRKTEKEKVTDYAEWRDLKLQCLPKVCPLGKSDVYLEFQKGSEYKDHKKGSEGELKERVENGKTG